MDSMLALAFSLFWPNLDGFTAELRLEFFFFDSPRAKASLSSHGHAQSASIIVESAFLSLFP